MAKRSKKRHGNKGLMDICTDLVVFGILVVLAVVVGLLVWDNVKDKWQKKADKPQATQEAQATPTSEEEGITVYKCVISSGDEMGTTEFEMKFNSNNMTYTETLLAGSEESQLDQGTYSMKEGELTTVSGKTTEEMNYLLDGNYLLATDQMYQGKIPEDAGKTFEGRFTYNIGDMGKTVIQFHKDGTYNYKTITYGDKENAEKGSPVGKDSVTKEKGTYEKEGNWITRTTDAGEEKLAYYIYQGKWITNAYYEKQ